MESVGFRTSASGLDRADSSSSIDSPRNALGIRQEEGTSSSRLASLHDPVGRSSGHRAVKPLAYDAQDLRAEAGNKLSWGRFKNWLADKLPFVGRTTYGRILQQAGAYAANAPNLPASKKREALTSIRNEIAAWQQKHPNETGGKANGLARMQDSVERAFQHEEANVLLERHAGLKERIADLPAKEQVQEMRQLRDDTIQWLRQTSLEDDSRAGTVSSLLNRLQDDLEQPTVNMLNEVLPQDLALSGLDGHVDMQGPFSDYGQLMFETILRGDVRALNEARQPKTVQINGFYPVSELFHKDVVKRNADLRLKTDDGTEVYSRRNPMGGDPRAALLAFTNGNARQAESLSHYVNQGAIAALEVGKVNTLNGPEGQSNFVQNGDKTFSYEVTRHEPKKPGDQVTYVIDYTLHDPVRLLETEAGPLACDFETSYIDARMQLTVTEDQLNAGNGAFTLTGDPTIDLHLELDREETLELSRLPI